MAAKKKSSGQPKPKTAFKKAVKKAVAKKPATKKVAPAKLKVTRSISTPIKLVPKRLVKKTTTPKPDANAGLDAALAGLGKQTAGTPLDAAALQQAQSTLTVDADSPIALPTGALAALRESGGLRFTSSDTVIYADGRVTQRDSAFGSMAKVVEHTASSAQLTAVRAALTAAAFEGSRVVNAPDAYVYEVVGHVAGKTLRVEATETHTTPALKALIVAINARA